MTDKSAEHARDTLNALIAGGYLSKALISTHGNRAELSKDYLRQVEELLREYYSTGPYEPKPGKAGSGPLGL